MLCADLGNIASLEDLRGIKAFEESSDVIVRGIAKQRLRGTDLYNLATLHDRNAMADANRLFNVMGDEDDGAMLFCLQANQFALHFVANQRVECREGFVHQQDGGVIRQRSGQAYPLLHTAGQLVRIAVGVAIEPYLFECLECTFMPFTFLYTRDFQAESNVVDHTHVGHQGKRLKHHAHVFATNAEKIGVRQTSDFLSVKMDRSGGWLDQSIEQPDHRRLPGTGKPHDDENLSTFYGETGIKNANDLTGFAENFTFISTASQHLHRELWLSTKDFVNVFYREYLVTKTHNPSCCKYDVRSRI
ncbi:hypothetical protein D9M71_56210 [compost metagenome]